MYVPLTGVSAPAPGTVTPLPGGEAAAIGLAALLIVLVPFLVPLVAHADTMAHEGMHALIAAVLGFTVLEVILERNANGRTITDAVSFGLRVLLVGLAGYLGPSVFGLSAAKLISTGRVTAVLWLAIILLVLLFFLVSRSFGLFSVPAAVLLLVLVMRYAHGGAEEFIVYLLTWLMLLSGLRTALVHGIDAGDAINLRQATHMPRRLWSLLWIAATFLALLVGGKWLVMPA